MHQVVLLGEGSLDRDETERRQPKAAPLEPRQELAGDRALHRVRLEDDEGPLDVLGHEAFSIAASSSAPGAESSLTVARGQTAAR